MQVSVENTGALQRKLTVQVPDEEIQDKVNTKLRELSKQVRIKGFRPGRVPMSVVKQRYGKQVRQDVVTETMQESLQQAIRDEALRPASQPQVDVEPEGLTSGDLEFSAMIEVYPEIAAIDAAALEIDTPESEVTDADVDDMLHTLREQRQSWSPVERTAAAGDQVLLEYSADTDEGRVPEEDTHRLAIIFGDSGFETLEKAVAKIPPGETKSVKLDFPENFREAELAGRKAKVELKVVSVSEPVLPEVDEEFIRSFGIEDGELDSLKVEIRENLERELKQARTSMLKMELIEKLIATTPDLEVPTSLVREEAAMMAAQLASRQGQDEPDPQLVESFMAPAEKRVRGGLLMGELARQNDIRANAAKVRDAIEMVASTYEEPSEVVQLYYSNHRLLQQVETSVMEEQVVDWVLENAKVTPRKMKFQEVISGATQAARTVK
jgi:trigger factor